MSEKKREDEFKSLVRTPAHVYPSTRTGILLVAQVASKWQLVQQNTICIGVISELGRVTMSEAISSRPQVNGILETSLYSSARSNRSSSIAGFSALRRLTPIRTRALPMRRDCVRCVPVTAAYSYCSRKVLQQTQTQLARSTLRSAFPGRNYQHGRHGCHSRGLRLS